MAWVVARKVVGLALIAFALTGSVWAQPELGTEQVAPSVGQTQGRKGDRQQLRNLHQKFEARRQEVLIRLSQRRVELAEMLRRDDSDKTTVKNKIHEILALERQRQELMVDEYFDAKNKLSPAQFETLRGRVLRGLLVSKKPSEGGKQ